MKEVDWQIYLTPEIDQKPYFGTVIFTVLFILDTNQICNRL